MPGFLDPQTAATIKRFGYGAWDNVSENFRLLKDLKRKAKIERNVGGTEMEAPFEAGRYQPIVSAPGMDLSAKFQPKVRHARFTLPWGEITNATVLDRGLLRRNSGQQALVKLRDTEIPAMIRDLFVATNGLSWQILNQNGETYAGAGLPFHGIPTFLLPAGTPGLEGYSMVTKDTTGAPVAATDKEACSDGTDFYAGQPLNPNGLTGIDNAEEDAWRPTLVNITSSAFGTGASAADNVLEYLQYGVNRGVRFSANDKSMMPDFGLLDWNLFNYLGDKLATKQTVFVQNTQTSVATPNLGYDPHSLRHAGVVWGWDNNMPANAGYLLNTDMIEMSIQPLFQDENDGSAPFKVGGDDMGVLELAVNFDPIRRQYLISATLPGQIAANPRYQVGFGAYA